MRALLEARGSQYHPGGSDPERRFLRVLEVAGLPAPVPQHRVVIKGRTFRLDGAYPDLMIGVEFDGFDYHTSRSDFDYDRERDRLLELAGWLMLHFTSRTPDAVIVRDVSEARRLRSHDPSK